MWRGLALSFALTGLALAVTAGGLVSSASAARATAASKLTARVPDRGTRLTLRRAASHLALHWRAHPNARVRVAFSRDGRRFGRYTPVGRDEAGEQRRNGETYGALMLARGARAIRIRSDRPLRRVSVLALTDRGTSAPVARTAGVAQPAVISRASWGADESLRFDAAGNEIWPPAFYPIQKLIVHHTAGLNNDPDPAATIRSIYYYHAVTQGWGDIGYNFLVDESGRVYEGRYSRPYAVGESPTGEDVAGNGVTAAHAVGFNSGTVGVALLGTLTDRDATPAARDALEGLLAWKAERHGIDPHGSSLYTNPVNGTQKTFPNIAGHRDVDATECPGGVFYATFPALRDAVAARIAGTPPPPPPAPSTSFPSEVTIDPGGGTLRTGDATALTADDSSYYQVTSTRSGTRTTSWYATFRGIPTAPNSLAVTYKGHNSRTATQTLWIRDWSGPDAGWEQLGPARSVGNTETTVSGLFPVPAAGETLSDYVGGPAADEVQVRVRSTRGGSSFVTSGNLLQLAY